MKKNYKLWEVTAPCYRKPIRFVPAKVGEPTLYHKCEKEAQKRLGNRKPPRLVHDGNICGARKSKSIIARMIMHFSDVT